MDSLHQVNQLFAGSRRSVSRLLISFVGHDADLGRVSTLPSFIDTLVTRLGGVNDVRDLIAVKWVNPSMRAIQTAAMAYLDSLAAVTVVSSEDFAGLTPLENLAPSEKSCP